MKLISQLLLKLIGASIIVASISLFALLVLEKKPKTKPLPSNNFQTHWNKHFTQYLNSQNGSYLKQNKHKVHKVLFFLLDHDLHHLKDNLLSPIQRKKHGTQTLEISFMSHTSEEHKNQKNVLIQYTLLDRKTKNLIWEGSQMIKKKPE